MTVAWILYAGLLLTIPWAQARKAGDARASAVAAWGLAGLVFGPLLLAVHGHPLTASVSGAALWGGFRLLDGAKRRILREPVVLGDVWLLRQMIAFPEFYFPFLSRPRKLLLAALPVLLLAGGLLGPAPVIAPGVRGALLGVGLLTPPVFALFFRTGPGRRFSRKHPTGSDAKADVDRYGLLGCVALHGAAMVAEAERVAVDVAPGTSGLSARCCWCPVSAGDEAGLPHVVMVQAESHVNLRRLDAGVGADWTRHFDRLAGEGRSGRLAAGTFGAYTVRTEFSVLTGIDRAALGVWGMNPYLLARRVPVGSLARRLGAAGYDTVFLHPHSLRFFSRDRVMPRLGFARCLGGAFFEGDERHGPHISDRALGRRIRALLTAAERPLFLFAVGVEAHGPWYPGRLSAYPPPSDATPLPEGLLRDRPGFAEYARHLRNTDAFLGGLAETAETLARPLTLAFYGDHPGYLVDAGSGSGAEGGTDYLVWRNDRRRKPDGAAATLPPEKLGAAVLAVALGPDAVISGS